MLAALEAYGWPGNVRELQNVIERACALADGERVSLGDLPEHLRSPVPTGDEVALPSDLGARMTLKEAKERWINQLESAYVAEVLKREGGNVSQAARKAAIDRKTLHRLLHKIACAKSQGSDRIALRTHNSGLNRPFSPKKAYQSHYTAEVAVGMGQVATPAGPRCPSHTGKALLDDRMSNLHEMEGIANRLG